MDVDLVYRLLLWSLALNYGMLLVWFFGIVFARGFIHRMHGRWFQISDATFDAIHYGAMAGYKLAIFMFNLVPLIALHLVRGGS